MGEVIRNKSAEVAADWWANTIHVGIRQNPGIDNSESSALLLFASLMSSTRIPYYKIESFKEDLANAVNERLEAGQEEVTLSVDYMACGLLREIAIENNIECDLGSSFPVKSWMGITKNKVSVICGEGAKEEVLYQANKRIGSDTLEASNSVKSSDVSEDSEIPKVSDDPSGPGV